MNKKEMDIQLIEACLLEKWWPKLNGTYQELDQSAFSSCVLCQVYRCGECSGCPLAENGKRCEADEHDPYSHYAHSLLHGTAYDRQAAILLMCEALTSLLPENHPWRIKC
jgi:hypothetical protein